MGSTIVTGGLGGIVGTILLIVAFFIIPGMQKLVFLALWLTPVMLSVAFDFKLGAALWGLVGFWVSLILTPFVSETLGVPGATRVVSDDAETPPSPEERADPRLPPASRNAEKDDELIGGVMTLRDAHNRVCRAHDGQTEKLKTALEELEDLRQLYTTLERQYWRDKEALHGEREQRQGLHRQLDEMTAEIAILRSTPVGVAESLAVLQKNLCDLDAAISATDPHDYANLEELKDRRAKLAGGVYRLHLMAKGFPPTPPPRADYSDEMVKELARTEARAPDQEDMTGILNWPKSST